jgi:hypothetical protein
MTDIIIRRGDQDTNHVNREKTATHKSKREDWQETNYSLQNSEKMSICCESSQSVVFGYDPIEDKVSIYCVTVFSLQIITLRGFQV